MDGASTAAATRWPPWRGGTRKTPPTPCPLLILSPRPASSQTLVAFLLHCSRHPLLPQLRPPLNPPPPASVFSIPCRHGLLSSSSSDSGPHPLLFLAMQGFPAELRPSSPLCSAPFLRRCGLSRPPPARAHALPTQPTLFSLPLGGPRRPCHSRASRAVCAPLPRVKAARPPLTRPGSACPWGPPVGAWERWIRVSLAFFFVFHMFV